MFTSSMFQSIKSALAKDETATNSSFRDIMKLEPNKTYTVRLLPNVKQPEKTFFHYFMHGWTSFATGQYVQALSLQSFGERDPISEERYKILRLGSDEEKKKAETVTRGEKWLVNVYVVEDPTNPDNNGTVKMVRYGRQLAKIIDSAVNGEEAKDLGERIFSLKADGCNLKIKVEKQGEFPTYVSSKFAFPSDLGLSESKINEIYANIHDLERVVGVKTREELLEMWNEHFLCKNNTPVVSQQSVAAKEHNHVESFETAAANSDSSTSNTSDDDLLDDETIQNLLKDLD